MAHKESVIILSVSAEHKDVWRWGRDGVVRGLSVGRLGLRFKVLTKVCKSFIVFFFPNFVLIWAPQCSGLNV